MRIDCVDLMQGLTPDQLALSPVAVLPWDSAFPGAQGTAPFGLEMPAFLPRRSFPCPMATARTTPLRRRFDPDGTTTAGNPPRLRARLEMVKGGEAATGDTVAPA